MSESVVADFRAQAWNSTHGTVIRERRIVMSTKRIVLVDDETKITIPISSIFDISDLAPLHLEVDRSSVITVGYRSDNTRHSATIVADQEVIDRFCSVLFKVVLNGTEVKVTGPYHSGGQGGGQQVGTLTVTPERMRFECENPITIATEHVVDVEEVGEPSSAPGEKAPAVRLEHENAQQLRETCIAFPSRPKMNVFGRYLRQYADGQEASVDAITVLFVDDEPGLAELIAQQVTREHGKIKARVATSAEEGLTLIKNAGDIDCVVSDYKMPGMDGIEFLETVRGVRPNLPFILFTGKGSEALAAKALATGVTDYITKGMGAAKYSEVASRIEQAVVQHRPHQSTTQTAQRAMEP